MKQDLPVKLSDYSLYPFKIPSIELDFCIQEEEVIVTSKMQIEPLFNSIQPLVLNGVDLKLLEVRIEGISLEKEKYKIISSQLIIFTEASRPFELQIINSINPFDNKSLEGLYESNGIITTQCEAEGFRRICFHPDRPDVLSKYKVRLEADYNKYPILLSNGNLVSHHKLIKGSNRHECVWSDPIPKACYIFALVAGKLIRVSDTFLTSSGKVVDINIFTQHHLSHNWRNKTWCC